LQGLSKPIENKVRDVFKGSIFYKTFSYSQSITLRIISGEFYKSNAKEPVILIAKSINELRSIVLQKGLPISSLVKHRLF